ncbi:hypothetical protein [Actinoplanes siamensis]|uniref:Uncharacterized protein n=1 Tax=Actinoplanes siamensis TaxID=1223317 RepID=A0A919NDP9_9ACTN|nr:hypothetical protein [Actinoplanes siamensis]GIF08715.1 hypothetical protein Asi03nite_62530 [Actinoplanes siamensis]
MTGLKPDAGRAYAVLDQIDARPELHNQSAWFHRTIGGCGTAACFAGWTSLLAGDEPLWTHDYQNQTDAVIGGGKRRYIEARATELLGIDPDQADALFYGGNTREDLGRLVEQIFGPRPGPPNRWAAMIPDPHPMANCGPLQMQLSPGVACPTCGTVPPVPELPTDDVPPNAGSAS